MVGAVSPLANAFATLLQPQPAVQSPLGAFLAENTAKPAAPPPMKQQDIINQRLNLKGMIDKLGTNNLMGTPTYQNLKRQYDDLGNQLRQYYPGVQG
jgi:hypothetical protein